MRAQTSMEFLLVLSVLLGLFVIFFLIFSSQNGLLIQNQDTLSASLNAQTLAAAINYVQLSGSGAQYNFSLTGVSSNENDTISSVAVQSARPDAVIDYPIISSNVNATHVIGGQMVIINSNGVIQIVQ